MRLLVIPLLLALPLVGQTISSKESKPLISNPQTQDTPRLEVVSEWVRELAAFREVYDRYLAEKKEGNNPAMDMIRNGARMKIELQTSINNLKGMSLTEESYKNLIPVVIGCYEKKIELFTETNEILGQFIVPKEGVDYGKLAARLPEITAAMEDLDKTLFQCNQMFCLMLISTKANSHGHLDHLILTRAERKDLADRLQDSFGDNLTAKDRNYSASSAFVLHSLLTGDHKSAEDPWD